jgi:catechol 2,3-dioxygenase-like lactoylglutathione lyase family enzyme
VNGLVVELDHAFLTLPAGGEAEARGFYTELLGLEEIERPAGLAESRGLWFRCGAQELHLGTDDQHAAAGRPHPGFRVERAEDLDELAGRLKRSGAEVEWDERIEGVRRFYTRDPFGNRLELLAKS